MFKQKLLILFSLIVICDAAVSVDNNQYKSTSDLISMTIDNWNDYLTKREIQPEAIIYNTDDKTTQIIYGSHRINWIKSKVNSKVRIDGMTIKLKDRLTINWVLDSTFDNVDFANNWEEVQFYNYNQRKIICIKMNFNPCTGIGCGVHYYLIYDLKNRSSNFFGSFRGSEDLKLYAFNNEDVELYFLAQSYYDKTLDDGSVILKYVPYSLKDDGTFVVKKNDDGSTCQTISTFFPDDTMKVERFEQNWIRKNNGW